MTVCAIIAHLHSMSSANYKPLKLSPILGAGFFFWLSRVRASELSFVRFDELVIFQALELRCHT